jgi:hypothetical protein
VPSKPNRDPSRHDATLSEVLEESARLKRQSAALLKRIAELEEKIAERLPLVSNRKSPPRKA